MSMNCELTLYRFLLFLSAARYTRVCMFTTTTHVVEISYLCGLSTSFISNQHFKCIAKLLTSDPPLLSLGKEVVVIESAW